jgi:hypothetical protein
MRDNRYGRKSTTLVATTTPKESGNNDDDVKKSTMATDAAVDSWTDADL